MLEGRTRWLSTGDDGAPSVLIVEDHTMLAQALALGLEEKGLACEVASLSAAAAVIGRAARLRPCLVLLDLDLGDLDGLDLLPDLRATGARVLVVTGCTDERRVAAAVALGAVGWVSKREPFEELLDTIELATRDRPVVGHVARDRMVDVGRAQLATERELRHRVALLTERERQVLAALTRGRTAQDIAHRFTVSVGTVRSHIRAILTKLDVSSQLAAVALVKDLSPSYERQLLGESFPGAKEPFGTAGDRGPTWRSA